MDLKQTTTTTTKPNLQMAPSPEESDYFYDEYIDYPYNETNAIDQNNTNASIKQETTTQQSSHYITGDTPTIYAAPNKDKQKQTQEIPKNTIPSPSSSGFTFFGVPLPSLNLNKLWPLAKKNAERKSDNRSGSARRNNFPPTNPDIQTGGFVPILPGSGGFVPMLHPPNIQQQKSNHNSSKKITTPNTTPLSISHPVTASSNQISYNSTPKIREEVTTFQTEILKIPTKKVEIKLNELEDFTAQPEVEIITDNSDSFEKIFHEVVENISVPNLIPIEPVTQTVNTITPNIVEEIPNKTVFVQNITETKKEGTPLSVFVAPGAQLPPFRASGKPTITKVFVPHVSSTASLLSPFNATEPLPSLKERRVFSNIDRDDSDNIPPHDSSMNWYFMNYNNTELQPYVDPALNSFVDNCVSKVGTSMFAIVFVIVSNYLI